MKIFQIWSALFVLLVPGVHLRAMPTVSAGGSHSCAILSGDLYCWGANDNGQIGNGNKANALRPVRIPHPQNHAWIGVSAGYFHTCAVDDTSAAYCWGSNGKGQLGTGAIADSLTPIQILNPDGLKPLTKVSDISVGDGSCAVADGKIACWGPNDYGQLGNNSTSPSSLPVLLSNPTNVSAVSGGLLHACARTENSQLYCWGWNYFGQLGDGTKNDSSVPLHIFDQILDVTVSESVTCAVGLARSVGKRLFCWGSNYYGQLGNNSNIGSATPVPVLDPAGTASLANVVSVSLGEFSACALDDGGAAYCWGFNGYGQLGDGTGIDANHAVQVRDAGGTDYLGNVAEISMGYRHACARQTDNSIWCWGKDEGGGLGDGRYGDRSLPVKIDFDEIFSANFQ